MTVMLKIAWIFNIILIAFVFGLLSFVFVVDEDHHFDLKVKDRQSTQTEVIPSVTGIIREAVVHPDQYLLKMKVENTLPMFVLAFSYFALFELLLMVILYQLRKMFESFSHDTPFSLANVRRLKTTSLCFALCLPFDALLLGTNYLILKQHGLGDRFMLVGELNYTWLIIAAVIYIMADIFRYGFEIQQENKEFV